MGHVTANQLFDWMCHWRLSAKFSLYVSKSLNTLCDHFLALGCLKMEERDLNLLELVRSTDFKVW